MLKPFLKRIRRKKRFSMTLIQEFLWCDHKTPTFHISYFFSSFTIISSHPTKLFLHLLIFLKTLELPFSQPRCSLPTLISTGEKINFFHVPNTSHLLIILNQIYLDFLLPKILAGNLLQSLLSGGQRAPSLLKIM